VAKFRLKPKPVRAIQLRWDTWSEMCEHIAATGDLTGRSEGCYVDQDGNETDDTNGRIGLKIPRKPGVEIAVQDDWIVRMDGELVVYNPEAFERLFESHADYKVEYEPDWGEYPKLADAFVHRPRENIYWKELRDLLVEARADAVQYVHDVRVEELAAARAEGQRRRPSTDAGTRAAAKTIDELSDDELIGALKNVGCYLLDCDGCAEVFFTGSKTHDHTCPIGR
jgi:hypothetical protein